MEVDKKKKKKQANEQCDLLYTYIRGYIHIHSSSLSISAIKPLDKIAQKYMTAIAFWFESVVARLKLGGHDYSIREFSPLYMQKV